MKIHTKANFIGRDFFTAKKDGKAYFNAQFLVDDDVVTTKFIKQADYELLQGVNRLDEVVIDLSLRKHQADDAYDLVLDMVSLIPKVNVDDKVKK